MFHDMTDCFTCPSDHYPNTDQTSCIPKVVMFLSYEEPLGIGIAICALSFVLITALVLRLFVKHHNSPIVRVNNWSLTYTLLISLLLSFLCPLLYLGRPEKVICILRQSAFGITCTMAVSAVLAKTVTVVLAFKATQPGSTLKNWLGRRLASSIILPCMIIEAVISIVSQAIFPPFPHAAMLSRAQEIILECHEPSTTMMYCEVIYMCFLTIVSFTVAFLARKLPDAFNESKFITFSIFAYSCIWLAFLPTYLSISRKSTVVIESLSMMFIQNYQHVLALEFAIKEINENPQLLPNITLGFNIYDSYLEAKGAYQATLQLISTRERFVPNYKCDNISNLMAVTEELTSDISRQIVDILGLYKILQLVFGSAAVSTDKNQAITVYRGEPNGVHQYRGIIQLLLHFNWTWIGFITTDEMNLQWFRKAMFPEFSRNGICFAILESFSSLAVDKEETALEFYNKVMNHKVHVLIFYGDISSMLCLRWLLNTGRKGTNHKPRGKVWILTTHTDLIYSTSYDDCDIQDFHGSLSFAIHSHELPGFQDFLQSRNVSSSKEDGFIRVFWESAFQCTFSSSPNNTKRAACTGEERLESLPEYIFPMSFTGQSYTIYNAVYAVAHALHAMYVSNSNNRAKMEGERRRFQNQQPWQLHHFLKMVSFNNSAGDQISFHQNGESVAGFDIINWVTFPNQSFVKVKVGRLDPQAPPHEVITINEDAIVWHRWFNQARPLSVCNDNCRPGYSKRNKEGEPFCCYDCIPCPAGKVSDQKDMADCFACPSDHYLNKDQISCIPKVVVFLSYEEPLGIGIVICALLFVLVTALVLMLFVKHHNSPIVKVNNRSLTYTLLISLLLCFLCPLLHIGRPEKVVCVFRQSAFGITFTMAISAMLAKTVTVVLAFKATQPGSTLKNWMGRRLASSIFLPCVITEAVISIVYQAISPPFPHADMLSTAQEIILECNEPSSITTYCELIYLCFLAIVGFTVAFLAQNLPDAFNEAKFITFSMFAFTCVWLAFLSTYLSIRGKNLVVMAVLSILASSAALLGFMFFPKCYIILWVPQLNSREQLRKWKL
ncbi:vomeronasal type-2 receptor 26-like [Tiliqua scincoides]|uniref:vomeronasal type-2 receptor 26-like n=1 Tax=Tiliqua scincoides TaxID=71010 RepID=UPI003461DCF1